MKTAAQALAEFATTLQFDQIPAAVVERAKDCMIDTVAVCTYCSTLESSSIVIDYVTQYSKSGASVILGTPHTVGAPHAAFANGALAHAFEMDNLTWPNSGVHPGATLLAPGLAVAQESPVSVYGPVPMTQPSVPAIGSSLNVFDSNLPRSSAAGRRSTSAPGADTACWKWFTLSSA